MAVNGNKICPKCGRQALNSGMAVCPNCNVPFALDSAPPTSPESATVYSWSAPAAEQGGGSPRTALWTMFVVGLAGICLVSWAFVNRLEANFEVKSAENVRELQAKNSNDLARAVSIISNQIVAQLAQPKIQSAIEKAARDHVNRVVASSINPALKDFQDVLNDASTRLVDVTNAIEDLRNKIDAAKNRLAQFPTNSPTVAATDNPSKPAETAPAAAAANSVKLTLVNRGITQSSSNYILSMVFQSGSAGGNVDMLAATYKQTARILSFTSINTTAPEAPAVNDTGDVAELKYSVEPNSVSSLVLVVSGPTIVRLASDQMDLQQTIPVAADKLNLGAIR